MDSGMAISGLQVAGLVTTLLAGSGALAFYFRFGVRLALVEKQAEKSARDSEQNGKDIAATKERVALVENTLQDIRNSLAKLNAIPDLQASMTSLKETVQEKLRDLVPRTEHIARWELQDKVMSDMKEQISDLRDELRK